MPKVFAHDVNGRLDAFHGPASDVWSLIRDDGRHPLAETDEMPISDLEQPIAPATRGEPTSALLWTSKNTRRLATVTGTTHSSL